MKALLRRVSTEVAEVLSRFETNLLRPPPSWSGQFLYTWRTRNRRASEEKKTCLRARFAPVGRHLPQAGDAEEGRRFGALDQTRHGLDGLQLVDQLLEQSIGPCSAQINHYSLCLKKPRHGQKTPLQRFFFSTTFPSSMCLWGSSLLRKKVHVSNKMTKKSLSIWFKESRKIWRA